VYSASRTGPPSARSGAGSQAALLDLGQVGEIVGDEHLALHDREVDLDLVEPGGVHRQVDQPQIGVGALQPFDGCLAAMGAAVVDDPKHPLSSGVGLGGHDLGDQPIERLDPSRRLAAAEQAGVVHVPGGQVGQRPAALVLVLHPHRSPSAHWQGGMAAAARLDAGLLVGADDVLAVAQRHTGENALV